MLPCFMLSLFTLSLEGYSLQSLSPRPSSRCAVRVPAFRSLPSFFNVKLSTASPERRRADFLVPQESTSVSFHGTYVPFVFILLRTLLHCKKSQLLSFHNFPNSLSKTPGWGIPIYSAISLLSLSHGTNPPLARLHRSER